MADWEFDFVAVEGKRTFLKVTDGCFVRIADISVIGTGVTSSVDGSPVAAPSVLAVHMANGSYAAFDPVGTREEAVERAQALAIAIAEAQAS
jgi:hypothetical protein